MSKKGEERDNSPSKHTFPASQCWQGCDGSGWSNSVCGLSFHLSHHGTESMLLKKISDVIKETFAKNVKEIKSNLQNQHATAH